MRIEVVGRQFEVTDPIRKYAEGKATRLSKYFDGIQLITVALRPTNHTHKPQYDAELVLDVEKHEDFVSHASAQDVYAAIDLVVEKGERQLRDFKEKLKLGKH